MPTYSVIKQGSEVEFSFFQDDSYTQAIYLPGTFSVTLIADASPLASVVTLQENIAIAGNLQQRTNEAGQVEAYYDTDLDIYWEDIDVFDTVDTTIVDSQQNAFYRLAIKPGEYSGVDGVIVGKLHSDVVGDDVLSITQGGTSSSTAEGARTNLSTYSKSQVDTLIAGVSAGTIDFSTLPGSHIPLFKTDQLLVNQTSGNTKITAEDLLTILSLGIQAPTDTTNNIDLIGTFQDEVLTFTSITLNSATETEAGLLSAPDKVILNNAAPLDSPIFTGMPKAPTQDPNSGSGSTGEADLIATCQYVDNLIDNLEETFAPFETSDKIVVDISGVPKLIRADNFYATETNPGLLSSDDKILLNNAAPLDSPNFTGIPEAPTAAVGTNTAQIATTAFVAEQAEIGDLNAIIAALIFGS